MNLGDLLDAVVAAFPKEPAAAQGDEMRSLLPSSGRPVSANPRL